MEKPGRRILDIVLREASAVADEAAYVGDPYSVDVLGARGRPRDAISIDPLGAWGERDAGIAGQAGSVTNG